MPAIESLHNALRAATSPAQTMQRVVDHAVRLVEGGDGAAVILILDGEPTYVCAGGSLAALVGQRVCVPGELPTQAIAAWRPFRSPTSTDAGHARSLACVPLRRGTQLIGALELSTCRRGSVSERELCLLERLEPFITAAIATALHLSETTEHALAAPRRGRGSRSETARASAFVAEVLSPGLAEDIALRDSITAAIGGAGVTTLFQPIIDLRTLKPVGAEALARFRLPPEQSPERWFAAARRAHLDVDLHRSAITNALRCAAPLPADKFLALNVDADALCSPSLVSLLERADLPLVLEITEHVPVSDYDALRRALTGLRRRGVAVAIDDAGTGYSSFAHIVKIAPDYIKVDIELVRGIDIDPIRRSVVSAVVAFAAETGAQVVAEGIETRGELDTLAALSVPYGQGYLLGRPAPVTRLLGRYARSNGLPRRD
jgi:EAL domain-containing protein (putative c-di-GMP-specific phosphodiesterase class I)